MAQSRLNVGKGSSGDLAAPTRGCLSGLWCCWWRAAARPALLPFPSAWSVLGVVCLWLGSKEIRISHFYLIEVGSSENWHGYQANLVNSSSCSKFPIFPCSPPISNNFLFSIPPDLDVCPMSVSHHLGYCSFVVPFIFCSSRISLFIITNGSKVLKEKAACIQ